MEYGNDYRTPKDRVNEAFIRELLENDNLPMGNSGLDHTDYQACGAEIRRFQRHEHGQIRVMPTAEVLPNEGTPSCDNECDCEKDNNVLSCGCGSCEGFRAPMLSGVPLAMVYSPYQEWESLYEAEIGFDRGTIFKCLDMPFYPTGCSSRSRCRQQSCR